MENEYTSLINILGNFGFPIMITIYLFVRFEKKIDNLENVISKLRTAIKELKKSEGWLMNRDNSKLLECYCKSREVQASFSKCLAEKELSPEEEKILFDANTKQFEISNELKNHICNYRWRTTISLIMISQTYLKIKLQYKNGVSFNIEIPFFILLDN